MTVEDKVLETGYWKDNRFYRNDGVVFHPIGDGTHYRPLFQCTTEGIAQALQGLVPL